jgi:SAM-dependent methyltransferase
MVNSTLAAVRQIGDDGVEAGRGPTQLGWYIFAASLLQGKTVLDVGCGLGHGLAILARSAHQVRGQDIDARLMSESNVVLGPLELIPDKSFDIATCIDVVEHVEDDIAFIKQLARVAREALFLTTPNWTISRCVWPYHLREYTPREFAELLSRVGRVQLFKGDSRGNQVHPVLWSGIYNYMNDLRIRPLTDYGMRAANRLLPAKSRLWGHNGALVTLSD